MNHRKRKTCFAIILVVAMLSSMTLPAWASDAAVGTSEAAGAVVTSEGATGAAEAVDATVTADPSATETTDGAVRSGDAVRTEDAGSMAGENAPAGSEDPADVPSAEGAIAADDGAMEEEVSDGNGDAENDADAFVVEEETEELFGTLANLGDEAVYVIHSALNRNFVWDVAGGSKKNGAAIQLYKANQSAAQRFRFRKNSDGTYTLYNVNAGKVVDVKGGSKAAKTPMQTYSANGTVAQRYYVLQNADGTVSFRSAATKYVVDVKSGKAVNKQPLWMYTANGSAAQKFVLELTTETGGTENYEGNYVIRSAINQNYVVDIASGSTANKANAQLYKFNGSAAQWFTIKKVGAYYTIINDKSGRALDVASGKTANRTNVWQYTANKTNAQLWRIERNMDGTFTFHSALSDKMVLDVASAKAANKSNLQIYSGNKSVAQKFVLDESAKKVVSTATTNTTSSSASTKLKAVSVISSANMQVLVNVLGAVESGGQVYGNRNYAAVAGKPWKNYVGSEVTITLGWAQYYGAQAQKLLRMIFDKDKAAFRKVDTDGSLEKMIEKNSSGGFTKNWVSMKWVPTKTQADRLVKLITSAAGKQAQDELFVEVVTPSINTCVNNYTKDVKAVMMYVEIAHLSPSGAKRVFNKIKNGTNGIKKGDYSLTNIMNALALDKKDTASSTQVGDKIYDTRHNKVKGWLETYVK